MTNSFSPRLISPAGDRTSLLAALHAGADAVYFGAEGCNMRAASRNFTVGDFPFIVSECRRHHAKAYLALNTVIYDSELDMVDETVSGAASAGIDAVICWDMAVVESCRRHGIPFHLSTQASVSNYRAVRWYASLGARMIVLARELTLQQVRHITEQVRRDGLDVAIECFVHGAMCVAVSGRCFLSQDVFGRSANRGACLQPCRRRYRIIDEEEGFEFELGPDSVMSPKDLCALPFLDQLLQAGITGFKIEGRNRSPEYVHTTTSVYRSAFDYILQHQDDPGFADTYRRFAEKQAEELRTVYNREFSDGFYFGKPLNAWTDAYGSMATEKKTYIGTVRKYYPKAEVAEMLMHTGELRLGDKLSIQGPTTGIVLMHAPPFRKNDHQADTAGKGDVVTIPCRQKVRKNDKVYVLRKTGE
ncbi:MAG: peptidase U32 family protein [Prosthecochloris sp.]|nr:peptidase U32 family protein [Prosthecochloris sp.]